MTRSAVVLSTSQASTAGGGGAQSEQSALLTAPGAPPSVDGFDSWTLKRSNNRDWPMSWARARWLRRSCCATAFVTGASAMLSACSPADPNGGVTLRNGDPAVVLQSCDNLDAVSVTNRDGKALWHVRASQPVGARELVIGGAHPGFVTEIALTEPLPADEAVIAHLQLSGSSISYDVPFEVDSLRDGWVRTSHTDVTDEDFASLVPQCGRNGGLITVVGLVILLVVAGCVALPFLMIGALRLAHRSPGP